MVFSAYSGVMHQSNRITPYYWISVESDIAHHESLP